MIRAPWVAGAAQLVDRSTSPDAEIRVDTISVAAGVCFRWGEGTITLKDGRCFVHMKYEDGDTIELRLTTQGAGIELAAESAHQAVLLTKQQSARRTHRDMDIEHR